MKLFAALAAFGCLCLSVAAIVLGGLNQDEGVYVYAANMVRDGFMPYRDFFFTQAPLMPRVYAFFGGAWDAFGLLGARLVTCAIGLAAIGFAVALARRLVPEDRRNTAGLVVFFLLGSNLYHLYYTSIPKTYALASLFVIAGFYALARAAASGARGRLCGLVASGLLLAFAAGTRISLGALLATTGFALLLSFRTRRWDFVWFGLGGVLGLAAVYGPVLADSGARAGLVAAQQYHTARGGFDAVFVVGSLSRLVRWYLPVFVLLGLGVAKVTCEVMSKPRGARDSRALSCAACARESRALRFSPIGFETTACLIGFAGVFAVQMLAPFPYEDYQVPVMSLLAVLAAVLVTAPQPSTLNAQPSTLLLALGLTWACSFGSPLLQEWMTNGQDRFWSIKKEKTELLQLRDVARRVEALDPKGQELLTQDLYLAVECRRRVPLGLELGPFAMLDDAGWTNLLSKTECPVAAFSGYGFAIEPPRCDERPVKRQMALWGILKDRYDLAFAEEMFGQNATTLLVLKRRK